MNVAEPEVTVRIQRDELLRLLDTMTPQAQQAITTRTPVVGRETSAKKAALLVPTAAPRIPPLRAKTHPGGTKPEPIVVAAAPAWEAPPRIEMTETPAADAIEIHSVPSIDSGHSIEVNPQATVMAAPRFTTLAATVIFLGICAAYLFA